MVFCIGETRVRLGMTLQRLQDLTSVNHIRKRAASAALLRLLLFFLFVVDRNRIQILCFENLSAIHAAQVIDTVPPVKKFGSLVLTTLHSEITPILD
jgi:hypothetical protein